jgi:two-component system NtrC family sensor kinase
VSSAVETILVVDDRAANRYPIVHALKKAGFDVTEAGSGREALELARRVPAAILLDVKLPDILGYEVCRRLKANPRTSHIPVLQLSAAFLDNESRVYALESGADAYLTQPVEPNVLIATVRSLVRLHAADVLTKLASKQWQATFDALSEGVALLDQSGRAQRCNRAMTEILQRSYSEIEGHIFGELLAECFGRSVELNRDNRPQQIAVGKRYLQVREEPIVVDGEQNGSIFVLTNISQQKLAEHAALENERLAATGRMANTIAHEINNPLEAITNLLFLLKPSAEAKPDSAEYLNAAEKELARVSRIARQILSFHRESLVPVEVNLSEILDDVLALNNRAIAERRLAVKKTCRGVVCVKGFPAQLRQVFSNLVRNAIEASTHDGEIRINISHCSFCREGLEGGVRITVADRGVGIAKANLGKIFDAFFTTKELKGTGVGLWLSSTIIREHRGRIQVRSNTEPGRSGSCLSVLLPVSSAVSSLKGESEMIRCELSPKAELLR